MFNQLSSYLEFIVDKVAISILAESDHSLVFGIDMSIESLRSQIFSNYIFFFLILSLVFFTYIIYLYLPKNLKDLKTGEKVMFVSIVIGVIIAVIIGYVQLIDGYLL